MGASAPYRPIQSTQILSVKLVRKADSFISEGALFRQGDCFRLARNLPRFGGRRDDRFLRADLSGQIRHGL